MNMLAVSQRVDVIQTYGERRDGLDQRWVAFLAACGALPLIIPNDVIAARQLVDAIPSTGVLLTGGNDLKENGGYAPERDSTEIALLEWGIEKGRPVLGICRGMQLIQQYFGVTLKRVEGHVLPKQTIQLNGVNEEVNSYHQYGSHDTVPDLTVWGVAYDGVVKAIRHRTLRVQGIMWHPERINPFRSSDVGYFRDYFGFGG